jgi:hypothetical protein
MTEVRATTPEGVVAAVVALVDERSDRVRVVVDGAAAAGPHELGAAVVAALSPRPAIHVRADAFWRPAGQRLEYGRHDDIAWLDDWLDEDALRREALGPFVVTGRVLPALRDPVTDRSVRLAAVEMPPGSVLVVSGSVLLGRGLPFDVTVHLRLSAAALVRRTPADETWTLPALTRYADERAPETLADLVVRADDPRHPAVVLRT